jgi:hypothetical protein
MISNPALANVVPDNPPITNNIIKPKENNTGTVKVNFPPHIVAIQLNIFIPVGTAIIIVAAVK